MRLENSKKRLSKAKTDNFIYTVSILANAGLVLSFGAFCIEESPPTQL